VLLARLPPGTDERARLEPVKQPVGLLDLSTPEGSKVELILVAGYI